MREVVKIVQLEEYQYSDPVTKFLKELYVEFDFEAAQCQLQLAERVVGNDFFLSEYREDFLDNARPHHRGVLPHSPADRRCRPLRSAQPFPRGRRENGLSTSSTTRGWLPTPRSTSKKYGASAEPLDQEHPLPNTNSVFTDA
ncbi:hypothetical protein BJV78DRAFT_1359460 [Lactifluus subvellereus]|nr:hypothetical protein BJV78DRAFT_1359460 [Lactifluus subvellereus]